MGRSGCQTWRVADDQEPDSISDSYQRWLEELAGGSVSVGWLITFWLVLGVGVFGTFALLGFESDAPAGTIVAVLSLVYWFWGVPRWARRCGERRRAQGHSDG